MIKPEQFFEICERFYFDWHEIEGCVVSKNFTNAKRIVKKMLEEGYAREDIERFCNHSHASMLLETFGKDARNTAKNRKHMAEFFQAITSHRLNKKYPHMRFAFEITEEDDDIEITYYHAD